MPFSILLESGDVLLLESGDVLLTEFQDPGPTVGFRFWDVRASETRWQVTSGQ